MRFALSILGTEVFAVSLSKDDVSTEDIAELIARAVTGGGNDGEIKDLSGGSFERDPHPLDPNDRYPEWEDKFGFS